ncbi:MAG: extracellular solute-binding protein [Lachnospiraceae bacterium]|nr:extracellular solute-binding protein [Lachnospiraceae bacterium]
MKTKKIISLFLSTLLVLSLAGCGNTSAGAAKGEAVSGSLVLYTSEPEELVSELIAAFNREYPDVAIELFRSGTGKVTAKMDAELATGSTMANLIWFADIGYMKNLDEQGMLVHYKAPNAAGIDPSYVYGDGFGTEVRLIYNVIAYNTAEVSAAPADWQDVTKEEYRGSFAIADPNYSGGSFTALVTHVQYPDAVGWKWYEDIMANECRFEQSNGALMTKVSSGEYKAAEIVDFQIRAAKAEGSPVDLVYPASGAVLVPTPLCIMNNVPEDSLEAAKAFVNWCLSDTAQEMLAAQQYIPVGNVAGPEGAPKASEIRVLPFDLDYFTRESAGIRETYTERFGGTEG